MALSQATLASGLEAMEPTTVEADAAQALVDAFSAYIGESTVNGVAATTAALAAAESAMLGALAGMSADSAGAAKIQAAIVAYWGVVAGIGGTVWILPAPPLVVGVTPPVGISTIAASLAPVFAANVSGSLNLADSADAIAAVIHAANAGGIAAVSPPAGTFPIL